MHLGELWGTESIPITRWAKQGIQPFDDTGHLKAHKNFLNTGAYLTISFQCCWAAWRYSTARGCVALSSSVGLSTSRSSPATTRQT